MNQAVSPPFGKRARGLAQPAQYKTRSLLSPVKLPDVEDLRCFVAVAECLSFKQGAARVGLVPTALSQRIKKLEAELSALLFLRTTRSVKLTEVGVALLPLARKALESMAQCRVLPGASPEVHLRLGSRFELSQSWLSHAWLLWEEQQPRVSLSLYVGSGPDILQQLVDARVDAIITSAPVARSDWSAEVLHAETYCLVAAPSLLRREPFKTPEDGREHTLLDIDATLPLARYLLSVCPELTFQRTRFCGAGAVVRELTLAGAGVAVLPEYMIAQDLTERRLHRLLPELKLLHDTFRMVYARSSVHAAELSALAKFLRGVPLS